MKRADIVRIIVLFWAVLTLPFYVLGALFVGSWNNFFASLDFESAGSMTFSDIGVAIFFLGPWLLIFVFLVRRVLSRQDKG